MFNPMGYEFKQILNQYFLYRKIKASRTELNKPSTEVPGKALNPLALDSFTVSSFYAIVFDLNFDFDTKTWKTL